MKTYSTHIPTAFDRHITLEEREAWLVPNVSQTRDSGALERSNFACFLEALGGESETVEVHRFGHWGPGWYEIILVDPNSPQAERARELCDALENYPVLNDEHFSNLEQEDANETWAKCYEVRERIEYIRRHRSQFEFHDFADMLGCVRGHYFAGYASELLH